MRAISALVIAGTHSGVGKTTVSLGLMAALRGRALRVQPFKIGPDFIDPGLHAKICGTPSYNLDGWMLSEGYNRRSFVSNVQDKDIAVVEGMMGLYDGRSGATEEGSTAEMAKRLDLPVVLVVDRRGSSQRRRHDTRLPQVRPQSPPRGSYLQPGRRTRSPRVS